MIKRKAAFFDRDGTLIKDVPFLSRLEDVELLPQAVELAQACLMQGYTLFVVSNQSGIARGFYDEAFVERTHEYLASLFAEHGVYFQDFYFCPHHPTEAVMPKYKIDCQCRKPKPGMLVQAAREHGIDLAQSILFGNEERDLAAGRAAGCWKAWNVTELFAFATPSYGTLVKPVESLRD
jgi:D-glycero-D-manno-heptose 1,7-bisphosphate phosphatase